MEGWRGGESSWGGLGWVWGGAYSCRRRQPWQPSPGLGGGSNGVNGGGSNGLNGGGGNGVYGGGGNGVHGLPGGQPTEPRLAAVGDIAVVVEGGGGSSINGAAMGQLVKRGPFSNAAEPAPVPASALLRHGML